jgi:DNA-binding CsgD family transcriptional regulator
MPITRQIGQAAANSYRTAGEANGGMEWRRLRAEYQRLRREFVSCGLDLSYTMATFSGLDPSDEEFRLKCRNMGRKGYSAVLRLMAGDRACTAGPEIEAKINRLRAVLGGQERPLEFVPPARTSEPVPRPDARPDTILTHRELEVLRCIAQGCSTKQAAGNLGITFKTAACHRYRIMEKLGIHETASLVRYAIRSGLVPA